MEQNIEQQVTRGGINPTALPKSFPFATEIISLPSEGLCYPENHPLSKGSIEIKLLTAKEEDILTSINLIRRNEHINKMLESIVVEPGVSINDILVGDKNAILVASRMLAFGAEYDVTVDDPETGEPTHVKVDLSQIQTKQLNKEILIMHPGPINRGVEMDSDVADGQQSIILDQVENGVAVRMACLYLLTGRTNP